jgi:hypothetical protein
LQAPSSKEDELLEEMRRVHSLISRTGPACETRILEALRRSLADEIDRQVAEVRKGDRAPQWMKDSVSAHIQGERELWAVAYPSEDALGKHVVQAWERFKESERAVNKETMRDWKENRKAALRFGPFLKTANQLRDDVLSGKEDQNLSRSAAELIYFRMGAVLEA